MTAKILIQRLGAEPAFFSLPDQWVTDRETARDFETTIAAIKFCEDHKLQNVQVLMDFGDPQWDTPLMVYNLRMRRADAGSRQAN